MSSENRSDLPGHSDLRIRNIFLQLIHWGPFAALFIIAYISLCTIYCHLHWWPPVDFPSLTHLTIFMSWIFLTLYHFALACWKGPGFVPLKWSPADRETQSKLQFCELCEGFKPPRAHHCRKCDRCVMKRDHHCPWINTCAGHFNHSSFVYFLLFAPVGCFHSLFILIPALFRALFFFSYIQDPSYEGPLIYLPPLYFMLCVFAVGLAVGVFFAVGFLCVTQFRVALHNETATESWIQAKAVHRRRYMAKRRQTRLANDSRRKPSHSSADESDSDDDVEPFVYPYQLGWRRNLAQVFTWSGWPKSNGFNWEVRAGCDPFDLTIEQLRQKAEKKSHMVQVKVLRSYSGTLCPVSFGCKALFLQPCSDEPRCRVTVGDQMRVSRFRKHWLYGDKLVAVDGQKRTRRERGWFPRACAELPKPNKETTSSSSSSSSAENASSNKS